MDSFAFKERKAVRLTSFLMSSPVRTGKLVLELGVGVLQEGLKRVGGIGTEVDKDETRLLLRSVLLGQPENVTRWLGLGRDGDGNSGRRLVVGRFSVCVRQSVVSPERDEQEDDHRQDGRRGENARFSSHVE